MSKTALTIWLILLLASCVQKSKYTLVLHVEDLDESGEKLVRELVDTIRQTSDSLAYFEGAATFLVYRNSFDLNGYKMSMGKPVDFKMYNDKGADLRQVLHPGAVHFIDAYYEERYRRAKPSIDKRRKKMLEQMNAP